MILKTTLFNEQFKELVKVTLAEKQQLNDQTDGNIRGCTIQQKDFFQDNNLPGKK